MITRASGTRWAVLMTLGGALLAGPDAYAQKRGGGGHSGGHGMNAPHVSAPRPAPRPPRMPNVMAPARRNALPGQNGQPFVQGQVYHHRSRASRALAHSNNATTRAGKAPSATSGAASTARSSSPGTAGGGIGPGTANPAVTASINARRGLPGSSSPLGYTYGTGSTTRRYRAFGYGSGYRNRYYGARYGYGRSQGINRGIVARLRSVHASLARLDHDYQGHRIQAMHAISMAIRQLSHRSMVYSGVGFAPGMNNRAGMGMRRSVLGGAGRGGQRLPQAQSDAIMGHALRSLQGIGMQLTNQGSYGMGQARARGYVGHAIHELNIALSIR